MARRRQPSRWTRLVRAWRGETLNAGIGEKIGLAQMIGALGYSGSGDVTESQAMRVPAFAAGVMRLTSSLGQLPLRLQRVSRDGAVEAIENHPMLDLIERPDMIRPGLTRTGLIRTVVQALAIHGNAYLWAKKRTKDSPHPYVLTPISGDRVNLVERNGHLHYQVMPRGSVGGVAVDDDQRTYTLRAPEICHFKGIYCEPEGWYGLSPLDYMSDVLKSGTEYNRHAIQSLNGGAVRGFLKTAHELGGDTISRIRAQTNDPHNEGRWLVLEEDMDAMVVSSTNVDAQFIEARNALVEDLSRFWLIPPHMLHVQQVTSWGTGIAEMTLGMVLYCLLPWADSIELTLGTSTLTEEERRSGLKWEFDFRRLLRGAPKDRSEFYGRMLETGAMTVEEVRRLEGLRDLTEAEKMAEKKMREPTPPPKPDAAPAAKKPMRAVK